MSISFSGLASGLDTSSWVTSLTQLRQAKVTKLEEQKQTVVTAQSTLQGIRSFFASFRTSLEKITDSKFNVSNMDIFSKKLAEVSNAAILSATAKSNAAEGSYEVKVDHTATQTQVKSGYRYKTTLVSTTQATTNSYLKNVGIGYGTDTEHGISAGKIEITHDGVMSEIEITSDETMSSFLGKLHDKGIEADFDNNTGIFSIGVSVGAIYDKDDTHILEKLHINDINYGYKNDVQLEKVEEHDVYEEATNNTLLTDLGVDVTAGQIRIDTATETCLINLDSDETIGSFVSALREEGIDATFNNGVFTINNAVIVEDGGTHLIEMFGLTTTDMTGEVVSQTQESEGLTYQTVSISTTVANGGTLLKDIDGVTLEGDETIVVQNKDGDTATVTVGATTTIDDMIEDMNEAGLDVELLDDGSISIKDGWIIDGGTFDVESVFGLTYVGTPGIVTGDALTESSTTVSVATDGTLLKDLTNPVTSGTILVTDTSGVEHELVIDENESISSVVNHIHSFGLGANYNNTTGVLTLTGGTYTTEGLSESDKSNFLEVFFDGAETLTPSTIDSAISTSQPLRRSVETTSIASGTTTLGALGLEEGNYTATFSVGGSEVTVDISDTTDINGLVSSLTGEGIHAEFDVNTGILALNGCEFVGVSGGNFADIMNFNETITGRYVTSDSVLAQSVTVGNEMTSAGAVYHSGEGSTTITTTVTTTSPIATTSDPLTYQSVTTTTTGGTSGLDVSSGSPLEYNTTITTPTSQSTDELTYQTGSMEGGTTTTVGETATSDTLYTVTPGGTTTTTTGQTLTSDTLMTGNTVSENQTSGTLTYTETVLNGGGTETTPIEGTQSSTLTYVTTEVTGGNATTVGNTTTQESNPLTYTVEGTGTTSTPVEIDAPTKTYALRVVGTPVLVPDGTVSGLSQTSGVLHNLIGSVTTSHTLSNISSGSTENVYGDTKHDYIDGVTNGYGEVESLVKGLNASASSTSTISYLLGRETNGKCEIVLSNGTALIYDESTTTANQIQQDLISAGVVSGGATTASGPAITYMSEGLSRIFFGTEYASLEGQTFEYVNDDPISVSVNMTAATKDIATARSSLTACSVSDLGTYAGNYAGKRFEITSSSDLQKFTKFLSLNPSVDTSDMTVIIDSASDINMNGQIDSFSGTILMAQTGGSIILDSSKGLSDAGKSGAVTSMFNTLDGATVKGLRFGATTSTGGILANTITNRTTVDGLEIEGVTASSALVAQSVTNSFIYNVTVSSSTVNASASEAGLFIGQSDGYSEISRVSITDSEIRGASGSNVSGFVIRTGSTDIKSVEMENVQVIASGSGSAVGFALETMDSNISIIAMRDVTVDSATTASGFVDSALSGSKLGRIYMDVCVSGTGGSTGFAFNNRGNVNNVNIRGNVLSSNGQACGFAGTNSGTIDGSSSHVTVSGLYASGFCANNAGGTIKNSIIDNVVIGKGTSSSSTSLSIIKNGTNYGNNITGTMVNTASGGTNTTGFSTIKNSYNLKSYTSSNTAGGTLTNCSGATYTIGKTNRAALGSWKLSQLAPNYNPTGDVLALSNGNSLTITSDTTIAQLDSFLTSNGMDLTSDGLIEAASEGLISAPSANLLGALGIIDGGQTTVTRPGGGDVDLGTEIGDIISGFRGGTFRLSTGGHVDIANNNTVQDLLEKLDNAGVEASFDATNQTITINESGSTNTVIDIGGDLRDIFGQVQTSEGTGYATEKYLLADFGVTGEGTITLSNGDSFAYRSKSSLNELTVTLSRKGLTASYDPATGELTLGGDGDSVYITNITGDFSSVFGIGAGEGVSYNSSSTSPMENIHTELSDLGIEDDVVITHHDGTTETFESSATVRDIVDYLNSNGYHADISHGVFYMSPNHNITEGKIITDMSDELATALGLTVGEGYTYVEGYTDIEDHEGETFHNVEQTVTITGTNMSVADSLYNLGFDNQTTIYTTDGNSASIEEHWTTFSDFISLLTDDLGLDVTVESNGVAVDLTDTTTTYSSFDIIFNAGDDNAISCIERVKEATPTLLDGLNIGYGTSGSFYYDASLTTEEEEETPTTETVTAEGSTTFGQLGLENTATITISGSRTIEVNTGDDIDYLVDAFNTAGFVASFNEDTGILSITPDEDDYIISMPSELTDILGISAGNGISYNIDYTEATTNTTTITADSSTTMAQLGMAHEGTMVNNLGQTLTVSTSQRIGELIQDINDFGLNATFDSETGEFSISNGDNFLTRISPNLAVALGINAGEDITYELEVTPASLEENTITATDSTTMAQLGLAHNGTITTDNGTVINVTTDMQMSQLVTALNEAGIETSLSSEGVLSVGGGNSTHYITDISSGVATILGIEAGANTSYSVTGAYADGSSTLADIGMSGQTARIVTDSQTITLNATDLIDDLITQLGDDFNASIDANGVLTIEPNEGHYIKSMSSNLALALGMEVGYENSYNINVETTDAVTTNQSATSSTTLAELGMIGSTAKIGTDYRTITLASTATIQDLVNELNDNGNGLDASFENGVLEIRPANDHYLKSMSSNLAQVLNMDVGYGSTYSVNIEGGEAGMVTNTADSSTTLEQLGLNTSGTIVTNNNQTITVLKTDRLDSLVGKLTADEIGISASFEDGVLTIGDSDDENFITSISPNLAAVLGLQAGENHTYTTSVSPEIATTDTVLTTLGMEADTNGYIRTNSGTITIASSMSIADVITEINDNNGFTASLTDGVFSIHPEEGHYITSISPDLASALGIESGLNITYQNTNEETETNNVIADLNTQLSTLGLNSNGVIFTDSTSIDISATDNISDLLGKLNDAEITANYNEDTGILTIGSADDEHYVTGMSSNLSPVLGNLSVGENFSYSVNTSVEEEEIGTTSNVTVDNSTTFGELGISDEGGIIHLSNGESVTVNSETTIDDFLSDITNKGVTVTLTNGIFHINSGDTYITGCEGDNILAAMNIFGSTSTVTDSTLGNTKLKDLRDSDGNLLGITSGDITAYKNGIAHNISIDNDDTLDELTAQLSAYNIHVAYGSGTSGEIHFTGSGNSYLSEITDGSNLLTKLGITDWDSDVDTASQPLKYTTSSDEVINMNTKMVELFKSDGTSAGVTTGKFKIVDNGVTYEGTITASTTVSDFFSALSVHGLTGTLNSDGQITLSTSNDNTYLDKTNGADGYSNVTDILFPSWTFGNIYNSDSMTDTEVNTTSISRDTKLKNIDSDVAYSAGKLIVSSNRTGETVDTVINLGENSKVGDFMSILSYHGFDSYIDNGRLVIRNDGYTTLKPYTIAPSEASNVLEVLGLDDTSEWEKPGYYTGTAQSSTSYNTSYVAATGDTLLSELRYGDGTPLDITAGEYYVYNNGIKHTLELTSTEISLNNFINTLSRYGINSTLNTQDGQTILKITGSGDSYLETSTAEGASNVVEKLFGDNEMSTLYKYSAYLETTEQVTSTVVASLGTMVSDYDQGDNKSEGILALTVNGNYSEINITSYETFGSLLEKFERAGVNASMEDGIIRLETGNKSFEIHAEHTTSHLLENLGLTYNSDLGDFAASTEAVTQTTTTIEDRTLSVANYADYDTQLSLLNISSGTLSVYRNGEKKLIEIDNTENFSQLRSKINAAFGNVDIRFDEGKLTFFSTTDDVQVGSSNDTSNISSICGFSQDENGNIVSARELYKVNASSVITTDGLFRLGQVTEGTFIVGDATFTINSDTTMQSIIAQINSSDKANASAYWDSVDGKLVISARNTGASIVNIEAGTSNFTDILGLTTSEWNDDGSLNSTRIRLESQEIGKNAKFSINGTNFQSASNVVTSDVSRIQGLTLNLKSSSMGDTVTVTIGKDAEAVTEAVNNFVESYNELVDNVDSELSATGVLKDQSTLKFIRQQIRNLLINTFSGATTFRNLAALGISTSAGNTVGIDTSNAGMEYLYFDAEKFMEGYDKDPEAVKSMLVGSDETPGILIQIENIVESALETGTGYFSAADKSYRDKISSINDKISKANAAIDAYRARLESKFQSMDLLISQMQNQYNSFLTTGMGV